MKASKQLVVLTCTYPMLAATSIAQDDALPSWNEGPTKEAILDFVASVTTEGSEDFVPVDQRIATFDNDGTLWSEQPIYVQLAFALDRVKTLAPEHPEWSWQEPFKSVLAGDVEHALAGGEQVIVEILAATHAGMTTDEFEQIVTDWIATARHPRTGRLYTQMVYQPMLELLEYLRANGFKTYIVSGGGVEFMRPWTERTYGIPPEQVIGSRAELKLDTRDGTPVLIKEPEVDLVDDGPGKPVGIEQMIGRRPLMAVGNSDGDQEMLEWATAGEGPGFALLVHHTDGEREVAYDRDSPIGTLDEALDAATERGWTIVSVENDWNTVFPPARITDAR
ncbi:MAG TPA: HAD family hydrolase [Gammaproteobacteria bacterium]